MSRSSTTGNACPRPWATAPRPRRGPAWKGSTGARPRDVLIPPLHSSGGGPALLGREPPPGRLERLALRPRLQLQVPGTVLGARAQGPRRAGAAVGLAEHHRDVRRAGVVELRAPGRGQLPLRAARPLALPVDLEAVDRVAALGLGLPARVHARGTEQLDAVVLAAAHQQLGVDVG